jgi:hypothetical protein
VISLAPRPQEKADADPPTPSAEALQPSDPTREYLAHILGGVAALRRVPRDADFDRMATPQGQVYTHRWRSRECIVWDNRCTQEGVWVKGEMLCPFLLLSWLRPMLTSSY